MTPTPKGLSMTTSEELERLDRWVKQQENGGCLDLYDPTPTIRSLIAACAQGATPPDGGVVEAVEAARAFLAKFDQKASPGALIFGSGATLRPQHLRTLVAALSRTAPVQAGDGELEPLYPISTDGPHEISDVRRWLARNLMDSRLTEAEALGVVAHHPSVQDQVKPKTLAQLAATPNPPGEVEGLQPGDLKWLLRHLDHEKYNGHCGEENAEARARREHNTRIDRLRQALSALGKEER